ncbi:hypothetical protein HS088_TW02G00722 [Tripterygium wilfordii]|uniref:Uncharacterized protein n=1 Tax=Tripterygium wilfordii TaxID=458696 RepID=A0A7J7DZA3_TRIWF|nr:uncharacterized protein At5g41620-like isoform X1 [Tripterygium wilfordii]KAF5751705.1 hypothetical protein HS088_TW02G00722 [Tripterygium wilfordii]
MEGKQHRGHSKIRKRGCSSSSSSSIVKRYRIKRAILVGLKGGSSTPVPTWKTNTKSPALAMPNVEFTPSQGREVPVSARKLAATLWEINNIPSPKKDLDKKELKNKEKLPQHLSDPSYSPDSEGMDRSRCQGHKKRTSIVTKKLQMTDYKFEGADSVNNTSLMEIETHSKHKTHNGCMVGIKTRLKDVSDGLTTSKELLKVLNHIWGLEEHHSAGISLVAVLRTELSRARNQVDQLIKEKRSYRNEVEDLVQHFAEEKAQWKSKERERILNANASMAAELEVEKKLRLQTERLNKKLGKELKDTKASLSKAMKELESEKRAKEILEQVCDELARGIGEDRAEMEQLKRESSKAREEVEKEREMLQLADVLREERVQMKLSEAKYHFEEKSAAVEKLRNELEAYLRTKIGDENDDGSPSFERIKELEAYLKKIQFGSYQNPDKEEDKLRIANGENHERDDSGDSDLHSIELSMDNNSKSYKWSYACDGDAQDDPKRTSVNKETKGRKSVTENPKWGGISLNGIDWDFITRSRENSERVDQEQLSEMVSNSRTLDYEDEIKRYKSVKSLRDHILSGPNTASVQNFAHPTQQWGQLLAMEGSGSPVSESSPVLQGDSLKHRLEMLRTKAERRSLGH